MQNAVTSVRLCLTTFRKKKNCILLNVCSCLQNTNNFNLRIHYVSGPCLWLDRHLQAWLPGLHDQRTGRAWGSSSRRSPRPEGCIKLEPSTTNRTAKRKADSRKRFLSIVIVIFLHVLWNVKWSIFLQVMDREEAIFQLAVLYYLCEES